MEPIIEDFTITLKYQVKIDTETGEMTTKCISRKVDKSNFELTEEKTKKKISKVVTNESSEPTLTLLDNKYCLNKAAVELMSIEPDCKLEIKYEKSGKTTIPIIMINENSGNRLTKSFTVSYRGNKNSELLKYGSEFILCPHENESGVFYLKNKNSVEVVEEESEDIEDIDLDLQDLIDDQDANITEISPALFKF